MRQCLRHLHSRLQAYHCDAEKVAAWAAVRECLQVLAPLHVLNLNLIVGHGSERPIPRPCEQVQQLSQCPPMARLTQRRSQSPPKHRSKLHLRSSKGRTLRSQQAWTPVSQSSATSVMHSLAAQWGKGGNRWRDSRGTRTHRLAQANSSIDGLSAHGVGDVLAIRRWLRYRLRCNDSVMTACGTLHAP